MSEHQDEFNTQLLASTNGLPDMAFSPDTKLLEQGILARIMREPALLHNGCELDPEHFQDGNLRNVAWAIKYLHENGGSPDVPNVTFRLSEMGELEKIGGGYALTGWSEFESIDIHGDLIRLQRQSAKLQARTLLYRCLENINGLSRTEIARVAQEILELTHDSHKESPLTRIMPRPQELLEMLSSETERREDIITGLLPVESLMVLYGVPKVGKTILAMNLAFHLAAGEDWHSLQIPKPRKVLYIIMEGGIQSLRSRLETIWLGAVSHDKGNLAIWAVPPLDIMNPAHFAALETEIEAFGPDVIFVDPLIKIHRADENDNAGMQRVMDQMRTLITAKNRTMIIVHHASKTGNTARGASSIVGDADASLRLAWEDREDHIGLRRLYFEDIRHVEAPMSLYLDLNPETLTFISNKSDQGIAERILVDAPEMTRRDLVAAIRARTGKSKSWAYAQLEVAQKEDRIEVNPDSKKLRLKQP